MDVFNAALDELEKELEHLGPYADSLRRNPEDEGQTKDLVDLLDGINKRIEEVKRIVREGVQHL